MKVCRAADRNRQYEESLFFYLLPFILYGKFSQFFGLASRKIRAIFMKSNRHTDPDEDAHFDMSFD